VKVGLGLMGMQEPLTALVVSPPAASGQQDGKERLLHALVQLAAYLKELETQSHLIHLNYEGSNFLSIHGFLKDQYEAHLDQFDTVSELVRSMDMYMPMCACGLKEQVSPCFQNVQTYQGTGMLATYLGNLEALGQLAKDVEPLATGIGALDVANYMADLVGVAFKSAWFIKASLR
jgi:hypothetical protein